MTEAIESELEKLNRTNIWDNEPVFCFTTDIDWASEAVLNAFFKELDLNSLKLTAFVTHSSPLIDDLFQQKKIERGIHPNFLQNSSHGTTFREVAETCISYAPEAFGFRCHRLFDVTDITHMLKNDFGFKYVSNLGTIMATKIRPLMHESGLIHFPVFFEDGTHLYNSMHLNIDRFEKYFKTPGIKIISFHSMHFVLNSPNFQFMRKIKDSMTRSEFNLLSAATIKGLQSKERGIRETIKQIFDLVSENNYKVFSLSELYHCSIS